MKLLKIANSIIAKGFGYEYKHDPEHRNKPVGTDWIKTKEGWSRGLKTPEPELPLGIGRNENEYQKFLQDAIQKRNLLTEERRIQNLKKEEQEKARALSEKRKQPNYMKAPNGKKTNLSESQWNQVQTPEFKKWFGKSLVVDENGEPLVVYHGSRNAGFTDFDNLSGKRHSNAPDGSSFFSDDLDVASTYSGTYSLVEPPIKEENEYGEEEIVNNEQGAGIYACFLKMENPLEFDFYGADWQGDLLGKYSGNNPDGDRILNKLGSEFFDSLEELYDEAEEQGINSEDIDVIENPFVGNSTNSAVREAIAEGCDGAILYNVVDNGSHGDCGASTVYVALDSKNIKSATNNNGSFSDPLDINAQEE